MTFNIEITKRDRKRKRRDGTVVVNVRWVLNYRDPKSDKRVQLFFERHKDALARRNEIISQVDQRTYVSEREVITVAEAVRRWLDDRRGEVKERTMRGYQQVSHYITGPLLSGTMEQRREYTDTGIMSEGTKLLRMLGGTKINELSTGAIRLWHKTVTEEVGAFSANRARTYLAAALALAAEDLNIRPPAMPSRTARGRHKIKKAILTPEQVARLLEDCRAMPEKGLYVAFPFLTGTRPSEQLALLWEEVDFERNVIRIRRVQEIDGSLGEVTKTAAGRRDIPMSQTMRLMLLAWRERCPWREGEAYRVFPGLGQRQLWPLPRTGGGGPLLYSNFRSRIWAPVLKRAGVPYITPHAARHTFISTMQAAGIEVALVAKIAGHANPVVTLGHYSHAVSRADVAVAALENAYAA